MSEATAYDIPLPSPLREAIARDWDPAPPMPHPARPDVAPYAARRRAAAVATLPRRAARRPGRDRCRRAPTTPTTRSGRAARSPG